VRAEAAALKSSGRARVEDLSVFRVRKETRKGKVLQRISGDDGVTINNIALYTHKHDQINPDLGVSDTFLTLIVMLA